MSKISPCFDVPEKVSREEILDMLIVFYPVGSGPLGMMRITCGLMLNLAVLRGFEPISEEEVRKRRIE